MPQERKDGGETGMRQEPIDERRRRLTTAVGAAVPAFFVLRHRSVRAQETTPAGSLVGSATHSPNVAARGGACRGCSPGMWASHPDRWPSGYGPGRGATRPGDGGTPFFAVFERTPHFSDLRDPAALTMMDVLHLKEGQDPHRLGAYFVAALLNAAAGLTEPLPAERVQQMWRHLATEGSYMPPPGVDRWYAEDVKRYLETTWA